MKKIRIFVSSVQKELELERVAVAGWVSADEQLSPHCKVVLFEKEPLTGKRISKPYLKCLESCQIYLLIIDCEYGNPPHFSATHEEYRFACDTGMPILVFLKGKTDGKREEKTKEFLQEIKDDKNTYRRFHDRLDLQPEIQASLRRVLKEHFSIEPSEPPTVPGEEVEAASTFELQPLNVSAKDLDLDQARKWLASIGLDQKKILSTDDNVFNALREKGLVRRDKNSFQAQAAGLIFLGKKPSDHFPQCRTFVDAFRGVEADSKPDDQDIISKPVPVMLDDMWDFIQKNTRHPMRVVGMNRIALEEYPREAVREAVVNAIAHRNYEDSARQILVRLFHDRLEILSPGLPMKPLTIAKIRQGKGHPCSRNPILGQYLNHLRLMDQRGSGIGRMKSAMLNHGLKAPEYDLVDGYFRVTLRGPGDNLDCLRAPEGTPTGIAPAIEEQLNDRQKDILARLAKGEKIASSVCMKLYGITRQAINADFAKLLDLGLIERTGAGPSTHYLLNTEHGIVKESSSET